MAKPFTVYTACMNPLATNCYILADEDNCIVIDPSYDDGQNIDRILNKICDLNVLAILLTHGHYDHISAVDLLVEKYHCPVYVSSVDYDYLFDNRLNMAQLVDPDFKFKSEVTIFSDSHMKIGNFEFDIKETPGHTPGSVSFVFDDIIFTGDSLFASSIGRMDLPGGSVKETKQTLKWYKSLQKNYLLYPGHGNSTHLDKEKKVNYYLTHHW